jgi:phosphoglycolate phosphatase-like HAD superfamily hydrolase
MKHRPTAVIVDVDGTLADVRSIRHHVAAKPKDFDAFHAASAHVPPNAQAIDFVARAHADGHRVVVVTARRQTWFDVTATWLHAHMPVPFDGPFHRQDDDFRPDVQVKADIHRYLARNYDIRAACDDNPNVIALWTRLGIPVEVVPGWDD